MKDTRYLTFALCKGRLAKQTLELLEELGITCEEMKDKNSRKLIFTNEELKLRFFLAKGPDVRERRYMRYWILVLVNAGCAYADRQMRKNIWRITN